MRQTTDLASLAAGPHGREGTQKEKPGTICVCDQNFRAGLHNLLKCLLYIFLHILEMPSRDEARSHQQPEGTENRCSVLGDPSPFSFAMSVAQQSRVDQRSAGAPRLSSSISLCLSFLLGKSCSRLINSDEPSSEIWLIY
jgi:hypothetical protein